METQGIKQCMGGARYLTMMGNDHHQAEGLSEILIQVGKEQWSKKSSVVLGSNSIMRIVVEV